MNAWRAFRSRPMLHDGLFALTLAVMGVVALRFDHHGEDAVRQPNVWAAILIVLGCLPLTFRQRHPVPVLAISTASLAVYQIADFPASTGELALLVAVYSVAAHAVQPWRKRATIAFFALTLVFLLGGIALNREGTGFEDIIGNAVVFGTAYVVGDNVRRRRERVADLEEKAARLERERELETRNAAAKERAAIARELHDVVAHSMTVMVVQASAARRVLASDPDLAERSIRLIEDTGRSSLVEMRRILGVLRNGDEAPSLAPQPGVERIGELVRAEIAAPVEFTEAGTPRPLPTVVDVSAYRIVQEALTNVRKHAGPARVRVALTYHDDALIIRVDDDGLGTNGVNGANGVNGVNGTGHGLTGMRERAALCGGVLASGPRRGGGWSVVARLPYEVEVPA